MYLAAGELVQTSSIEGESHIGALAAAVQA